MKKRIISAITTTRHAVYAIFHLSFLSSPSSSSFPWGAKHNEPLVILRLKTCFNTAVASLLTFMFVVSPSLFLVVHEHLYAIMQSILVTLIVHQSLTGLARNSYDLLQGGVIGCTSGYLIWLISPNIYVALFLFFIVTFCIGAYDPMLLRPLFMRVSTWDMFVIIFFPVDNQNIIDILFMFLMHITTVICGFIPFLLFWPNLSTRQFPKEFKICCGDCLSLFKGISTYMTDLTHTIRADEAPAARTPSFSHELKRIKIDPPSSSSSPLPIPLATLAQLSQSSSQSFNNKYNNNNGLNNNILVSDSGTNSPGSIDTSLTHELLEERISHDKSLVKFEKDFNRNLRRLHRVNRETKWEPWNEETLKEYENMILNLELCLHQMKAIKQACSRGFFSSGIGLNFLLPMVPIFDDLQSYIISNLNQLCSPSGVPPESDTFESLISQMEEQYMECAKVFEARGVAANPTSALTRMVFLLFGTVELAKNIDAITKSMRKLKKPTQSPVVEFLLNYYKDFNLITSIVSTTKEWINHILSLLDFQTNFIKYMKSYAWVFPLQLTVGCTIVAYIMNQFKLDILPVQHWTGIWSCITFEIVILPSLGATLKRSFHRMVGTVVGAYVGFACVRIARDLDDVARDFLLSFFIMIFIGISSYIQQVPRYAYTGMVTAFTFLLVFDGQYFTKKPDVYYPTMRSLHIIFGLVLVLLASLLIFPQKSYVKFQALLHSTTLEIVGLCELAVEEGFKVEPSAEIRSKIMQVRGKLQTLRVLMKQSKPELLFHKASFITFKKGATHLLQTYYALISIHGAACSGFRQETIERVLGPLRQPMLAVVTAVQNSSKTILQENENDVDDDFIRDAVVQLDQAFLEMRRYLVEEKLYFEAHPDLRNVSKLIYSMREFAKQWSKLKEVVRACMKREAVKEY